MFFLFNFKNMYPVKEKRKKLKVKLIGSNENGWKTLAQSTNYDVLARADRFHDSNN